MPLGFSKLFVIEIILSILFGYGTGNWMSGFVLFILFIVSTIIWRFLTYE